MSNFKHDFPETAFSKTVNIKSRKPLQQFEWKFTRRCRKLFLIMCREHIFQYKFLKKKNNICPTRNGLNHIHQHKNCINLFIKILLSTQDGDCLTNHKNAFTLCFRQFTCPESCSSVRRCIAHYAFTFICITFIPVNIFKIFFLCIKVDEITIKNWNKKLSLYSFIISEHASEKGLDFEL